MATKDTSKKDTRARVWGAVVYPESAPEGWRDILDGLAVPWCESPLHDQDLDPDGNPKKPHWHIILAFDGKKSWDQVKEITDQLHAPIPQRIASTRGAVRYMAHLDNPEKHQYPSSKIISHGGMDVAHHLRATAGSRYEMIREMMDFIRQSDIVEMEDLMVYAAESRFDDWWPLLCDNSAYIIGQLLKSRRHRADRELSTPPRSDPSTGEVIP